MSQSSTTQSDNTQDFLRDSQIAAPLLGALLNAHARAVAEPASSPAGWHGPDDIQTLQGLGGNYLWLENPLQIVRISFRFNPAHVGSQGTYEIISGLSTLERGTFNSLPNNPVVGWAAITLVPGDNPKPRTFIVSGMLTDVNWTIQILELNNLGAQGPIPPPFFAVRIS